MSGGQPTKYQPEYCQMLIDHMTQGLSFQSFAGVVGVDRDTIYNWIHLFPEFSDARNKANEAGRLSLEKLGIALAAGKVDGNVAAWIFTMKNRMGWRDRQEIEHTGKDGGPIQTISHEISSEELERRTLAISKRLLLKEAD